MTAAAKLRGLAGSRVRRPALSNLSACPVKSMQPWTSRRRARRRGSADQAHSKDGRTLRSGLPDGLSVHFAISIARVSKPSHQMQLCSARPLAVSSGTSAWPQPVQDVVRFMRFSAIVEIRPVILGAEACAGTMAAPERYAGPARSFRTT